MAAAVTALDEQCNRVIKLMEAGEWDESVKIIFSDYLAAFQNCSNACVELYNASDAVGIAFDKGATSSINSAVVLLLILFIVMLVLSVFISVITTRAITRPLVEIENVAKKISEGTLKNDIKYQSRDEIGLLADSFRVTSTVLENIISDAIRLMRGIADGNFNIRIASEAYYVGEFRPMLMTLRSMALSLSDTMRQINQSADQVASGSDQVSSGAQGLSQGTTEQASAVEELAATINEISAQVQHTAANAVQASGQTQSAGEQASSIAQVTQGIDQISNVVQTNSATAEESAAASEELSGQATILKSLVSKFKLRETNIVSLGAPPPSADTPERPAAKQPAAKRYAAKWPASAYTPGSKY